MTWCIVNATFGEAYDEFQPRLIASLDKHWTGSRMIWTNELPKGWPSHTECPFGFKLHAIKAARDAGHTGVIWLDGGGYLTRPLDKLIGHTERDGYYIVEGDKPLSWWVSDDALRGLGITRKEIADAGWLLCGGTPYAFDFTNPLTVKFFDRWWVAMEAGLFKHVAGDSSTDFHGHRHDEAVASVLAHQMGMKPSPFGGFYVGDERDTDISVLRSGQHRFKDGMKIEVVDNHSVATEFLTGSHVLDAGARGFVFSKWFAERGHTVIAMDPSPDMEDPGIPGVVFKPYALVGSNVKSPTLITTDDPGAWYISEKQPGRVVGFAGINTYDMSWDVIKLNIEGSEYDILEEWPGPTARQVVVSFHEHTPRARGRAECDRLINKMRQWYTPFNVVWEPRYCCHENYWDVLFIRNDLVEA